MKTKLKAKEIYSNAQNRYEYKSRSTFQSKSNYISIDVGFNVRKF